VTGDALLVAAVNEVDRADVVHIPANRRALPGGDVGIVGAQVGVDLVPAAGAAAHRRVGVRHLDADPHDFAKGLPQGVSRICQKPWKTP
jgi:hypothetical protein